MANGHRLLLLQAIGRLVVPELVEAEQAGYLPGRIRTVKGAIPVRVPEVRCGAATSGAS